MAAGGEANGLDFGRKGLKDEEIVVLLRRQRNSTLFTRDAGFYQPTLRHSNYCIVVASVGQNEVAAFIRRFLQRSYTSPSHGSESPNSREVQIWTVAA